MSPLRVNGIQLEVKQIAGSAMASPIVFLHEGLGSVSLWTQRGIDWPQQVCEATGRAGVVYSRRGYGQSDPTPGNLPADYMHREAWEVLPALLQALHIDKPVLLGHSDGATIALLYASERPVSACIALAPHVLVEDVAFDIRQACSRITAPLLLIQGLDDEYGTLRQLDEIAQAAPHAAQLRLPDCGHSPQRDQPDTSRHAVVAFLRTAA
ncbi:MAG: alpha/beta hydrolase [Polaromonas sp. 24-62-144]|nr:MAG: alpha/beta hydrolase [Polaromonas sp. 24-62-144]